MSFKPTDLRYGQNIINNYLATIEAQQRQTQLETEQQRLEQEHEHQTNVFNLAKAAQDFQQTVEKHNLAQKYIQNAQDTGTAPPGGSIEQPALSSPEPNSGNVPISQTLGLGVNQQRVNLPPELGLPSATTLNPQAAAELRGKTGAAEIEPKALLEAGKQRDITQRELNLEFMRIQQKTMQDEMDRQSRESIAREETRRAMGVAQLTKMSALQNSILENTIGNFDKHPAVRNYDTLKVANATAQGEPSDLELLTAYHKALHPEQASTPEYAFTLPQTLPSFAERLGLKFDNITNPKKFIPDAMREDVKKQIKNQLDIRAKAYQLYRSGESNKLKSFGVENPEPLLTDHSKDFTSGPQKGDKKNGFVFDGTGWEKDTGQYDKK